MGDNKYISGPDENGKRYFNIKVSEVYDEETEQETPAGGKNTVKNAVLIIAMIILLLAIVGILFRNMNLSLGTDGVHISLGNGSVTKPSAEDIPSEKFVATMHVEGTIQASNTDYFGNPTGYQHDWTLRAIDKLMEDENNVGIILTVDSPGGTVYESDELYLKLREYQEETERPYYVVMGSTCASGGYYISAGTDRIFANRNTWTGSIGVTIGNIFDFSQLMENYGVKVKTITSGDYKAMGSSYREMSAEEEAIWQALVDESYEQFVGIVADGRDLDVDYVKKYADGRIISALQAIDYGLVDEIGGTDEALADMIDRFSLDEDVLNYDYSPNLQSRGIYRLLNGIAQSMKSSNEAATVIGLTEKYSSMPVSYICEPLI